MDERRSDREEPPLSCSEQAAVHSRLDVERSENFARRAAIDVISGFTASVAVAPVVVILDTAVTEAAFGQRALLPSIRAAFWSMLSRPHRVVVTRPFTAMLALYGGTYWIANTCDTVAEIAHKRAPSTHDTSLAKLGVVSAVNMSLSLYKEHAFAVTFGTVTAVGTATKATALTRGYRKMLPGLTYLPFVLRDAITIFASFNMPHALAARVPSAWEEHIGISRLSIAQLTAPAASQLVVTPLHLLGLDLYNRRAQLDWQERWAAMTRGWFSTSVARMLRVIPGLAVGNVINTNIRTSMIEHETQAQVPSTVDRG